MNRAYLRLKACPRCKGDLLIDRAIEDAEVCIQCGYRKFGIITHDTHSPNQLDKTFTVVSKQDSSKAMEKA